MLKIRYIIARFPQVSLMTFFPRDCGKNLTDSTTVRIPQINHNRKNLDYHVKSGLSEIPILRYSIRSGNPFVEFVCFERYNQIVDDNFTSHCKC